MNAAPQSSEVSAPISIDPVWTGTGWVRQLTGLSNSKIESLARRGLIPAYRKPGIKNWRFKSDEIKRWWAAGYNGAVVDRAERKSPAR